MGGKSSSAPPPDPRLVEGQLKSMGIQDSQIQQYIDLQAQLTPIQIKEMEKGIARADSQYQHDLTREGVLDARDQQQWDYNVGRNKFQDERQLGLDARAAKEFDFTMDYNKAALAANSAASAGANAAAMANAGANGMSASANMRMADTNSRLADSSIKMTDYQYAQMQERDKRWREVGLPQEDALIAKVNEMGSDKYRDQQMGMAVGDINQGYSDSRQQTLRAMGRMGMNGNSGQMASMMARGNADQALAVAGTKNKMRTALTQTDLANKFQLNGAMKGMAGMGDMSAGLAINAIGAGKQGYMSGGGGGGGGGGGFGPMGFAGTGGGGGYGGGNGGGSVYGGYSAPNASMGMNIANAGVGGILGTYQNASGMAGGMGSNASSMYSSMGNVYSAGQNQQGSMMGSILGAGATIGAAFI